MSKKTEINEKSIKATAAQNHRDFQGIAKALTTGHTEDCPKWYEQYRAAELLFCPPWELDEVFNETPRASRTEWVLRAGIVNRAVQVARQAQQRFMERQARKIKQHTDDHLKVSLETAGGTIQE